MSIWQELRTSIIALMVFTVITGLAYPLVVTGVAQIAFSKAANGSLIPGADGKVLGSEWIGQPFDDPKYFWSRPSATTPAYNGASSSGSNLAIGNPAQLDAIAQRVKKLREADPENKAEVPIDLVTASGSGLDPHISPAAAHYQAARVARVRRLPEAVVRKLVLECSEPRQFGILGEPSVNVLRLNLSLDDASGAIRDNGVR